MKPTFSRFGVAALVSGTILSTIAPLQSFAETYAGTVNTPILNVRSDSSTTAEVVGKLTEGTKVNVYSVNNDWAQIDFEGQKRYVSSTYLTLSTKTEESSVSELYTAEANVNMRSSTSTSSSILTVVPEDAIVTYISSHGATGSWYKVNFGKYTGYVAAQYFTPTSSTLFAATTVALYDSTGSGATKIATLPEGAKVTYIASLGATGSWYKLQYGNLTGYAPARYFTSSQISTASTYSYYATTNVALYNSSSSGATKIATVPSGAKVTSSSTIEANSSRYKIQYGGMSGYVTGKYFSSSPPAEMTITPYYAQTNVVMYDSATAGAKKIETVPTGAVVEQLSQTMYPNSRYKIRYNGKIGYATAKYFSTNPPEELVITPYYATTKVAMYDSAVAGAKNIGTIPFGAKVEQLSQTVYANSRYRIRYNGKIGYATSKYFSLRDPNVVVKADYYATQNVVLYNRSDSQKVKIAVIPSGTKVQQVSEYGLSNTYFKIEYGSMTGYSTAKYFSKNAPVTEQYDTERQVRTTDKLNVRSTPEVTLTNKVGSLESGITVSVKPIIGSEWGRLTSGTYSGSYIHLYYTTPVIITPPATEISKVVSYTNYAMTLQDMAEKQVAKFAQTDAHRSDKAYLPRAWVTVEGTIGTITKPEMRVVTGLGTSLKMDPTSTAGTLIVIPNGSDVTYLGRVTSGSTTWYKVQYDSMTGYVTPSSVVGTADILSDDALASHPYGQINPGEKVLITGQVGNYYTISYTRPVGHNIRIFDNTWRRASVSDVLPYVDPSQISPNSLDFYQFLDLSKSAGTTATTLNKVLTSTGTLSGQGQSFIDAGKQYGVNEVYLLAHALHETGNGTSLLATGVPVDKDGVALINTEGKRIYPERTEVAKVYNMYGIKATDGNALANGAKFAFEQQWTSPKAAIVGGAYWIGKNYINHPTYKQNTLYKMRFNPSSPGDHQYATDIGWASKQTTDIYKTYQTLDAYTLHFDVPKYQ